MVKAAIQLNRYTSIKQASVHLLLMKKEPPTQQNWFVYLIDSDAGLYCGITTNVNRRFSEHLSGKGAKFFRRAAPKQIVYVECCANRADASQRENQIKRLTRKQKLQLIANTQ
ncbi:GIY-YIG nuclease family protein [Zooshikella ganghwensis]|uniref:GIY-YIG nuclease family protein n=1 Tax=Zooshikella ganghwensis TaxID=202772 RepID=UPI001F43EE2E|nr:GIY-YIG nuclease family protein [Zooshikella ganghwensis]